MTYRTIIESKNEKKIDKYRDHVTLKCYEVKHIIHILCINDTFYRNQMQIKIMFCFLSHKVQELRCLFNYVIIIRFFNWTHYYSIKYFECELNRLNILECEINTKGSLSRFLERTFFYICEVENDMSVYRFHMIESSKTLYHHIP